MDAVYIATTPYHNHGTENRISSVFFFGVILGASSPFKMGASGHGAFCYLISARWIGLDSPKLQGLSAQLRAVEIIRRVTQTALIGRMNCRDTVGRSGVLRLHITKSEKFTGAFVQDGLLAMGRWRRGFRGVVCLPCNWAMKSIFAHNTC